MKIAILTDSTCNLTKEFKEKHENLFVVPLGISIDEATYRDQVDITSKEVYDSLDNHKVKSSLPSASDIYNTIDDIIAKGYDKLFVITISSGLSGTYNAVRLITEEYDQIDITLYDSKVLAMGLGFMVMEAIRLIDKGMELVNVIEKLNVLRYENMTTVYTLNTLKYLREGGRIGKVEGTIGDILRIKPIISVNDDGVYFTKAKARGNRRAISKSIEILKERYQDQKINVAVHYGNDLEKAQMFLERLKATLNIHKGTIVELTPVLGIHTGPGLIAAIAYTV
ncbi:DegV family protein [Mycoplasmatota bacterium WC44]